MNPRKTLLLMMVLLFAGGLTIYAAGIGISFNKYRSIAAVEVDGKIYLDLEDVAEKMHAIVERKGSKVALHKPNVNLIPIFEKNEKYTGQIYKGMTTSLVVHVAIDGIDLKVSELKLVLNSPYEEEMVLKHIKNPEFQYGEYIFNSGIIEYHFKYTAKYYLRLWLKPEGDDRFHLVGEKGFYVTS